MIPHPAVVVSLYALCIFGFIAGLCLGRIVWRTLRGWVRPRRGRPRWGYVGSENEIVRDIVKNARRSHPWAEGADVEYRLADGTRVDILTDQYAYEVDWAWKWAEGVGQCIHYSIMTQRMAGLVLLVRHGPTVDTEAAADRRAVGRARKVCRRCGIQLVLIRAMPQPRAA